MVSKVTPRQVVARMVSGSSVSFVDVRTKKDFARSDWKIAGAVRATIDSLLQDAAKVSRSRLVVVYGSHGGEADVRRAAEELRGYGFGEVRILSGGFEAWSDLHFAVQPSREAALN